MKQIIILLMAALSLGLQAQDTGEEPVSQEREFPVIDESSLTFEEPAGEAGLTDSLESGSITLTDYLRVIFFLALVIVLVWLFIRLLRRYSGNRFGDQEMINVMGSQALTAETSLHVVEVENSYYLLGASSSNISLITEITEEETVDALKLKRSQSYDRQGKNFFEMLMGLTPRENAPGEEASEKSVDFLKGRRDRLKDL